MTRKLLLVIFLCSFVSYGQTFQSGTGTQPEEGTSFISNDLSKPLNIDKVSEVKETYWSTRDIKKKGSGYKPYKRWEHYWGHFADAQGNLPTAKDLWDTWQNKQVGTGRTNPTSNWNSAGPFEVGVFSGRLPGIGRTNQIAVDPNNENTWYVGAPAGGLWKSTDSGQSWTNLFDDFPQIGVSGIAIDPNDSNIIYIATGDDDAADSYSVGVFKSTDGGQTWNQTGLNPTNTDVNSLMNEIVIDPTNSDILWVGTSFGLLKSLDAGDTWIPLLEGEYISDFKLKPGDPNTVYAVANGHIGGAGNFTAYYKTEDGGATFSEMDDPVNPANQTLPRSCGRVVLGVSPADPDVLYILTANTGANNFSYQGFYKSTDSGETFTESPNTENIMESSQAWFDLALEVSPTNADEVYMGCLNIWRSNNGGNSWIRLNRWFINDEAYTHADIHALKFFNGKLFACTDGGIYASENGGATFTDYTTGMAIGQFYRLSVSPTDASKMIGGLQDNGGQVLNGGQWNNYHGGDGMDNVIDPNNDNIVYGFTQFGGSLNVSTDSGQSVGFVGPPDDDEGNNIQGNWITPLAIGADSQVYAGYDAIYRLNGNSWEKLYTIPSTEGGIEDLEVDPTNPSVIYAAEGNFVHRSEDGGENFTVFFNARSPIADIAINTTDGSFIYVVTALRVGRRQSLQLNPNQVPERKVWKVPVNNGVAGLEIDITGNLPTDQAFFSLVHQGRHTDNPLYLGTSLGVYRIDDTLTEWEDYFTNFPNVAVSDLDINLDEELITASTYGRGVWQSPIPIQVPEDDVRLVALTPANDLVLCGEIFPEITVENNGENPITEVSVAYSLNGGGNESFDATVNLNAGESTVIPLPSLNISTLGEATLEVTVTVANDTFAENNNTLHKFYVNEFGVGDAINSFETVDDALITYNDGVDSPSVWERGVPTGTLLNLAATGTQVYGTNLDGNHPDGVKSVLVSNCYELSSILAPVLKFQMAYELEDNFDIVYVQYSTDDGLNWSVLGNINSQPNWYNSDRTNDSSGEADDCQNCPGAQWTGTNTTLTEYAYDFTANAALGEPDLTNEPNVLFRIVFHADPAVNREGVIIDDFVVEGFQDDDDDDNDGILDIADNCPLIGNANQLDTDGDGEGDACDVDDDNDGILDMDDNCPLTANADQADADNDGIGDVCDDDADNDGVPNSIDQCANTPEGAVVNVTGCEVFTLPATNFQVLVTGTSCVGSNDGSISIEAVEILDYTASISGTSLDESQTFSESTAFTDLPEGDYRVCITVAVQPEYELCFDLIVNRPEDLSVSSSISSLNNELTLALAGGKQYIITLNNEVFRTSEPEITLPLSEIENTLSVRTEKDCQGIYEETIFLSSELIVYPNPVRGSNLNIFLGDNQLKEVELSLYTLNGEKIMAKKYETINNQVQLNVGGLARGVYLLNIKTEKSLLNFKIIRR